MNLDHIKQGYEEAKKQRTNVESVIDDAFFYTRPLKAISKVSGQPADYTKIYDNTATASVNNLVANVLTFLIPQNARWAYIDVVENIRKQGLPADYRTFLEQENDRLFQLLLASNFYVAAGAALEDAIIAGTGCLGVELGADLQSLVFIAVPTSELYILENAQGIVDIVYRRHEIPARSLSKQYKRLPEWASKLAEESPNKKVCIIECQYPDSEGGYHYGKYLEQDWHELDTFTCDYKPFTVFRWQKSSGDVWGDSPVRQALSDIRQLNNFVENISVASDFAAQGAWQSSDDQLRGQSILPRTVIIHSQDEDIKPIQFPGELRIGYQQVETLQMKVRKALYDDSLPAGNAVKGVVATAISAMQEQFYRVLAVPAFNLENEFLREILLSVMALAQRNKLMAPIDAHRFGFKVTVQSVVTKGQKREKAQQIMQSVAMLGPLAQIAMQMQMIDVTGLVQEVLELMDFPQHLIKQPPQVSPEQLQQLLPMLQQAMQGQTPALATGQPPTPAA